jgi:hypothetical protein
MSSGGHAVRLEGGAHALRHARDGVLEDVLPVHDGVVPARVQVLVGDAREVGGRVALAPQHLGVLAIGVEVRGQHAATGILGGPQDGGAGAIAEQHAQVPALRAEVHATGVNLRADQQDALVLAHADPRVGNGQAVEEAGALVAHVQRRHAGYAELALEVDAAAGEEVVGAERRVDDAVDVAGLHVRALESDARGFHRQVGARLLAGLDPVPLLDAGPLADPLVGRVPVLRQFVVGDDPIRDVVAEADERGARHRFRGAGCQCGTARHHLTAGCVARSSGAPAESDDGVEMLLRHGLHGQPALPRDEHVVERLHALQQVQRHEAFELLDEGVRRPCTSAGPRATPSGRSTRRPDPARCGPDTPRG